VQTGDGKVTGNHRERRHDGGDYCRPTKPVCNEADEQRAADRADQRGIDQVEAASVVSARMRRPVNPPRAHSAIERQPTVIQAGKRSGRERAGDRDERHTRRARQQKGRTDSQRKQRHGESDSEAKRKDNRQRESNPGDSHRHVIANKCRYRR
jgi:hypothetical protein